MCSKDWLLRQIGIKERFKIRIIPEFPNDHIDVGDKMTVTSLSFVDSHQILKSLFIFVGHIYRVTEIKILSPILTRLHHDVIKIKL